MGWFVVNNQGTQIRNMGVVKLSRGLWLWQLKKLIANKVKYIEREMLGE